MSYQEALERSIETFTAISEATSEADDLATELIHIQATRAATEARNELQQLLDQRLDLNLKSRDSETAVRVGVLGRLLTQLQSSLNYILWALRSGPGVKGKPPASIVASAAAEVLALAPGSLEVAMRRSDLQVTDDFRSEEHTSELQSRENLVCRLLLEKKKQTYELKVAYYTPILVIVVRTTSVQLTSKADHHGQGQLDIKRNHTLALNHLYGHLLEVSY